ncbi:LysM peptidoglycan-binding domain-containing protein [Bifidobacterium boum]|nr:LysM peptidoglycan-binding domain-containing protein [Bifidobacterium boum]
MWQYAQQVTPPGGDVRGTVRDIVELNHLQSTELMPGQTIVVPVDR